MSEQVFYPGGTGATSADGLTQLPLPTLSKGTTHTDVDTCKLCESMLRGSKALGFLFLV